MLPRPYPRFVLRAEHPRADDEHLRAPRDASPTAATGGWSAGWAGPAPAGAPVRAASRRRAPGRRVQQRPARVGAGAAWPSRRELGLPPSGPRDRVPQRHAAGGDRRRSKPPRPPPIADLAGAPHVVRILPHTLAPRQVSADRHTAYDVVLLDFAPDDSPRSIPILEPLLHHPDGRRRRPGRRARVLRRRPGRVRIGPAAERADLAAAGGARAGRRVRVARGGRPCRWPSAGRRCVVALAVIFVAASAHADEHLRAQPRDAPGTGPRRGLLAADDEPLPRGAARRAWPAADDRDVTPEELRDVVGEAVEATVATAGRAVFFSGLTVLLGLIGMLLFEFMIMRSVGLAGAIVVGFAVAGGADAAAGPAVHPRSAAGRLAVRRVNPAVERRRARGRDSPAGSWTARWPCSCRRSGCCCSWARRSSTSASTPRTRRSCRRRVPSRAAFDLLQRAVRRGRVRAARRSPSGRTGRRRRRPTSPRSTTGPAASRPTRASRRVESLVDVDPRLTLAQYQLLYGGARRPAGSLPPAAAGRRRPAATSRRSRSTRRTARTATRRGRSSTTCERRVGRARAAGRACSVLVGGGAAEVTDVVGADRAPTSRGPALFILVSTYLVLFVLLRSVRPAGEGARHEHAVDPGVVRRARLDLPGRQPVGARSASSHSGSSRRASR